MDNDNANPFDESQEMQPPADIDTSMQPLDEENTGRRLLIWFLVSIIIVGCAVLFGGAFVLFRPNMTSLMGQFVPSPTPTITPTPTPNLTTTASMFQSTAVNAQNEWPLNLKEGFDNDSYKWYIGIDDNQYDKITYTVKDGKYHWDVTAHKGFIQWIRLSEKSFGDFYISADAQETGNPAIGDYGIIFREDSHGNHYYFAITHGGQFYVALYYKEKWQDLITSEYSSFIQQNESNRLTVWGKDSHFIFFINGHYIGEMTDDHITQGKISIAVGLYNSPDESSFEFDNLELRSPAPPATLTPTQTPTPAITATRLDSANSTKTAQVFQSTATAAASKWKIILADKFQSDSKNWEVLTSDFNSAFFKVLDGKYNWDITSHQLSVNWATANTRPLRDFVMSVDARQLSGPSKAEYGVVFRGFSDFHGYYFGINNDGEYTLQLHEKDWIKLISYTKSELIRPGEVNHLTVIGEGSHFIFFINGQYLTEFTDKRIEKGQVGLITILYQTYKHAIFEFDNLELKVP